MHKSAQPRRGLFRGRVRRVIAVVATLMVFGAIVTVTAVSSAKTRRPPNNQAAQCGPDVPGAEAPDGQNTRTSEQNGRTVRDHWGDGQEPPPGCAPNAAGSASGSASASASASASGSASGSASADPSASASAGGKNNGGKNNNNQNNNNQNQGGKLQILADNCKQGSKLQLHDGFQNGRRCVDTQMGEVGDANRNPSLLITQAPQQVKVNQPFTIRVSTRNLIRDRFLAAGQGGYYVEMSLLNAQGLTRGHFHTACRMLDSTKVAPDPAPPPAFFVATEDGGGSARPDQIDIKVPGLPAKGTAQCASWAGDGSHRLPMMQRANQTPAFDAVRITVN